MPHHKCVRTHGQNNKEMSLCLIDADDKSVQWTEGKLDKYKTLTIVNWFGQRSYLDGLICDLIQINFFKLDTKHEIMLLRPLSTRCICKNHNMLLSDSQTIVWLKPTRWDRENWQNLIWANIIGFRANCSCRINSEVHVRHMQSFI